MDTNYLATLRNRLETLDGALMRAERIGYRAPGINRARSRPSSIGATASRQRAVGAQNALPADETDQA